MASDLWMFAGVWIIGAIVSVDWDMERSYRCRQAQMFIVLAVSLKLKPRK